MAKSAIELEFPSGGLNRRYAVQKQRPYTSADLLNVRPESALDGRERGGSRPGLSRAFTTALGSGNPVRLLNQLREVFSANVVNVNDEFSVALSSDWTAMPWSSTFDGETTGGLPTNVGSNLLSLESLGTGSSAVIEAARFKAVNMNTAQSYSVSLNAQLGPSGAAGVNGQYYMFLRMDDTTPNVQVAGVSAKLFFHQNTGTQKYASVRLNVVVAGVLNVYTWNNITDTSFADTRYLIWTMTVIGDVVSSTLNGVSLGSQNIAAHGAAAGKRIGFAVRHGAAGNDGLSSIDFFNVDYFVGSGETGVVNRTRMMASSNGTLYRENEAMVFEAVTDVTQGTNSDLNLASDRLLESSERLGFLFIADNGVRVQGTDGSLAGAADGGGTLDETRYSATFDDAAVSDWRTVADIGDTLWIYSAVAAGNVKLCRISAIPGAGNGDSLTVVSNTAFTNAASGVSYRVLRGPKVYSSSGNTLRSWTTSADADTATFFNGTMPFGCSLIARHLDRMYLAGAVDFPHVWYASRQGDPYDFDYGDPSSDLQRAIASANSDAGDFGEPITALIPFQDDYLIFGARSSMWILRGNPVQGGRINNMSRITGCLSARSWCYSPGGELFVLGSDGVYVFQVGTGGFAESNRNGSFSRDRIPDELQNIDPTMHTITMGYNVNDRGIHIFITPNSPFAGQRHWWIDLETSGFFPLSVPFTMEATASHYYTSDSPISNAMLIGGRDGYVRKFDKAATTDDETSISSHVFLGPIQTGQPGITDGYIDEIIGTPAVDSGVFGWNLYVGKTAEAALGSDPVANGSFTTAGFNRSFRPRRRGQSAFIRLAGTVPWAVEGLTVTRGGFGRLRTG